MGEVISLGHGHNLEIPPVEFLELAKQWGGGLERVLVIGIGPTGTFHFGGSTCDVGKLMMLAKLAERELMNGAAEAVGID